MEDQFSDRVARSLRLKLTGEDTGPLSELSTKNVDAYEAYIRGRYFWNRRTEQAITKGLRYFQQAVALDPNFAEAHAGVADSYALLGLYGLLPPKEAFPPAEDAAKKALAINDDLAEAHATLGFVYFYYGWNGRAAEQEFRRALDANPGYAMAHSWNGQDLAARHRIPEALRETELAQQDDPLSLIVSCNAGLVLLVAGRQEQLLIFLAKPWRSTPTSLARTSGSEMSMSNAACRTKRSRSSRRLCVCGMAGNVKEARRILEILKRRARTHYVPAYAVALVCAGLHEKDGAFEWLEKAYNDRSASMALMNVDPALDSLHSDARYEQLVRRANF